MNKGKVRIYELSRELAQENKHIENKDILAICDELDIAVKSHSSTITETDANRIRAVAQAGDYKPNNQAVKAKPPRSNSSSAKPTIAKKPVRPREQQILGILRHPRPAAPPESDVRPPTPPQPQQTSQGVSQFSKSCPGRTA